MFLRDHQPWQFTTAVFFLPRLKTVSIIAQNSILFAAIEVLFLWREKNPWIRFEKDSGKSMGEL